MDEQPQGPVTLGGPAERIVAAGSPPTEALRVNLARTAVPVAIPPEQEVLLAITAPWYGVRQQTGELLREINHRFVAWPQTLDELHRRAIGDFHYHLRDPRVAEGVAVLGSLYLKVAREARPDALRADAIRHLLRYVELVATSSGPRRAECLAAIRPALGAIGPLIGEAPALARRTAAPLKRLARKLPGEADAVSTRVLVGELLVVALSQTYRHWQASEDPAAWYRQIVGPTAPLPEAVLAVAGRRMAALEAALAGWSPARTGPLLDLPDEGDLARGCLDAAGVFASDPDPSRGLVRRLHWLFRVLEREDLESAHEAALREVGRLLASSAPGASGAARAGLISEVFALLRARGQVGVPPVQQLIALLGRQVLSDGDPEAVAALNHELVELDFSYPDFAGFTDEWDVRVNPDHLRQIRTYLALIESDPERARPLVAALLVHLRVGGVFIADTDLFQKDISSLLGRRIAPVWFEVKQLLRVFPAYFSEIGAEGALRADSTRLDEIIGRRDPLCHFLRKQSHVECNPRLAAFAGEIARYWASGDPAPLADYVPASLLEGLEHGAPERSLGEVLTRLAAPSGTLDGVLDLEPATLQARLDELSELDPLSREKIRLLLAVRREIAGKYELHHDDLIARLDEFRRVDATLVRRLGDALAAGRTRAALEALLEILERLQAIILTPGPPRPQENIYRKRHIAAGIPSLYGSYREERFDALALTFRAESLARILFAELIAAPDGTTLDGLADLIGLLLRAVRLDGFRATGLEHALGMLREARTRPEVSPAQYVNIMQLISRGVERMLRARILATYEGPVQQIVARLVNQGRLEGREGGRAAVLANSERFLRDLIAQCHGLEALDALTARLLERPGGLAVSVPARPRTSLPSPRRTLVPIGPAPLAHGGVIALGNKGYMLCRLVELGFPVPEGFILGTDLFAARGAFAAGAPRRRLAATVLSHVARLERASGLRFGDPEQPLLLSVRSGAALSMPGMLETFLNVGINPLVAAGLAADPDRSWAAWDAYRRFLQLWGMSHGIERDRFDALMADAKRRHGVSRKSALSPARMRDLAQGYRALLADHRVTLLEDPVAQLLRVIELVQASWDGERARLYRRELGIADEWGTAVIVQRMVFGNLGPRAGSGVVLTHNPERDAQAVELHGDFAVQAQGEDVVGGLVVTFPISEHQRRTESPGSALSLERDFPAIYGRLAAMARTLVVDHGMAHQELEFTFEGERASDLHVLQTRDALDAPPAPTAFRPSPALARDHVADGVGVGGGALSGRVAYALEHIAALRARHPADNVILVRPDTVPDDIPLVLQVDGLLTSLGGATSHAAVAAARLGKTCVVGCRGLEMVGPTGPARLDGRPLDVGTPISINGNGGGVYWNAHAVRDLHAVAPDAGAEAGSGRVAGLGYRPGPT
jgi:pyruvate, orthophosphate dikinase